MWVRGELPATYGKFIEELDGPGQIELYDHGRMTGGTWRHIAGAPRDTIPDAQDVIDELVAEYETEAAWSAKRRPTEGAPRGAGVEAKLTPKVSLFPAATETYPHRQ